VVDEERGRRGEADMPKVWEEGSKEWDILD